MTAALVSGADLVCEVQGASLTLWSYATKDSDPALLNGDYWQPVTSQLRLGDRIFVHSRAHGASHCFTLAVVYHDKKKVKVAVEQVLKTE